MADGKDCKCGAYYYGDCACGADWTPKEVYTLQAKLDGTLRGVAWLQAELAEARKELTCGVCGGPVMILDSQCPACFEQWKREREEAYARRRTEDKQRLDAVLAARAAKREREKGFIEKLKSVRRQKISAFKI